MCVPGPRDLELVHSANLQTAPREHVEAGCKKQPAPPGCVCSVPYVNQAGRTVSRWLLDAAEPRPLYPELCGDLELIANL